MKPRKMTACMTPGFHSRRIIRDCRKPLRNTLPSRAAGWSQRTSGARCVTIRSFRAARKPKAAKEASINSEIQSGPIGSQKESPAPGKVDQLCLARRRPEPK